MATEQAPNVYASPMEEHDPIVYQLFSWEGEVVGHLRYEDGWRWLQDGPRSTVDRELLLSEKQFGELEFELGADAGELRAALDSARNSPLHG